MCHSVHHHVWYENYHQMQHKIEDLRGQWRGDKHLLPARNTHQRNLKIALGVPCNSIWEFSFHPKALDPGHMQDIPKCENNKGLYDPSSIQLGFWQSIVKPQCMTNSKRQQSQVINPMVAPVKISVMDH
jgi:hypothetical protein